jgi:hypothetical protein
VDALDHDSLRRYGGRPMLRCLGGGGICPALLVLIDRGFVFATALVQWGIEARLWSRL